MFTINVTRLSPFIWMSMNPGAMIAPWQSICSSAAIFSSKNIGSGFIIFPLRIHRSSIMIWWFRTRRQFLNWIVFPDAVVMATNNELLRKIRKNMLFKPIRSGKMLFAKFYWHNSLTAERRFNIFLSLLVVDRLCIVYFLHSTRFLRRSSIKYK